MRADKLSDSCPDKALTVRTDKGGAYSPLVRRPVVQSKLSGDNEGSMRASEAGVKGRERDQVSGAPEPSAGSLCAGCGNPFEPTRPGARYCRELRQASRPEVLTSRHSVEKFVSSASGAVTRGGAVSGFSKGRR